MKRKILVFDRAVRGIGGANGVSLDGRMFAPASLFDRPSLKMKQVNARSMVIDGESYIQLIKTSELNGAPVYGVEGDPEFEHMFYVVYERDRPVHGHRPLPYPANFDRPFIVDCLDPHYPDHYHFAIVGSEEIEATGEPPHPLLPCGWAYREEPRRNDRS